MTELKDSDGTVLNLSQGRVVKLIVTSRYVCG